MDKLFAGFFCPEEGAEGTEGNDESQGRRLDFAKDFSEEALSRRCHIVVDDCQLLKCWKSNRKPAEKSVNG